MAFGISKAMLSPLMVLNFCLYLIAAAIAGSVLNLYLDAASGVVGTSPPTGNVVTPWFIIVTLITCMVGLASVLAGLHHVRVWRTESLAGAAATSVIGWTLTVVLGPFFQGDPHWRRSQQETGKTVEAFMIILTFTELLYLFALHAGTVTMRAMLTLPAKGL